MIFQIEDGRGQLFQWDINRRLIITDKSITQVHFCNRTEDTALVCEVYEDNGIRVVDIPNILLQDSWRINVYAFDKEYTKIETVFNVVSRSKPADYVYTETEVITWNTFEERIEILENTVTAEGISQAVKEYLAENPVEVNLDNYYTKEETDAAIAQVVDAIPDVDFTGLATEKYVDDAIANLDIPEAEVDLSNYYTKEETNAAIAGIKIPEPDLTNYATKQYVSEAVAAIEIPSTTGFITMEDVEGKGYQTADDVQTAINTALGVIENGTY